jgi:hypothetical protein
MRHSLYLLGIGAKARISVVRRLQVSSFRGILQSFAHLFPFVCASVPVSPGSSSLLSPARAYTMSTVALFPFLIQIHRILAKLDESIRF